VVVAVAVVPGCGGDSCKIDTTYNPAIVPTSFVAVVDNPMFPLTPGTRYEYQNGDEHVTTIVTSDHKVVLGVTCAVVHDTSMVNGELVEDTYDWYAQDRDGNVWYMGEDTKEFDANGHVISTEGSWEAGVDGAVPGVIMLADPQVDDAYRQEFYAGQAEDQAWIVRMGGSFTVPYGTVHDVIRSLEWTRLEPNVVTLKVYAPGLGIIYERTLSGGKEIAALMSVTTG
jgi:hypothetical protein